MTSLKKKLLILGAGNAQIDLIEYAKKLGLEVHVCSYSNTDKGIPLADSFAQINIVDTDRIEAYVRENQIDFVYSVGSDIAVPTVCRVAERTGKFHFVSGRSFAVINITCGKHWEWNPITMFRIWSAGAFRRQKRRIFIPSW